MTPREREMIVDLWAHLQCAERQSIPTDDQIIMGHVRDARDIAAVLLGHAGTAVEQPDMEEAVS